MADEIKISVPPEGGQPPPAAPEGVSQKEVDEGKVFAILSYIIPLFGLVPLIMRNNAFALYHAKQVLLLLIGGVAISLVNIIPCLGQIIFVAAALFLFVLAIIGLINAIKGEMKPLPLVGKWGVEWFKGITKV